MARSAHDRHLVRDAAAAGAPETAVRRVYGRGRDAGTTLLRLVQARIPDYHANLVALPRAPADERETYVRTNLRSLVLEYAHDLLFERLARYAYEFHYLGFGGVRDPVSYFLACTWFREQYLAPGWVEEEDWPLLAAVAAMLRCHVVDASRFRSGASHPERSGTPPDRGDIHATRHHA